MKVMSMSVKELKTDAVRIMDDRNDTNWSSHYA